MPARLSVELQGGAIQPSDPAASQVASRPQTRIITARAGPASSALGSATGFQVRDSYHFLLLPLPPCLQFRVTRQRQLDRFAGLGRFVDRQDDLHAAAALGSIDRRGRALVDRLHDVLELLGMGVMPDGRRIGRAAAAARRSAIGPERPVAQSSSSQNPI